MPGPELVVVRDHPVHRVPDDEHLHAHSDDQDDNLTLVLENERRHVVWFKNIFGLKIQMGRVGQVETKTTESKLELKVSLVVKFKVKVADIFVCTMLMREASYLEAAKQPHFNWQ